MNLSTAAMFPIFLLLNPGCGMVVAFIGLTNKEFEIFVKQPAFNPKELE